MSVTFLALAQHLASGNIKSGKECRRSVSQIVMRVALQIAKSQGKRWLTAFKSMAMAFFVYAKDERIRRRVKVKADNVSDLLYEKRVDREIETPTPVGFDPNELQIRWTVDVDTPVSAVKSLQV